MARLLVTGGAGYIGSHTSVGLLQAGHEVVSLDNYSNSSPRALERVQRIAGRPLTAIEAMSATRRCSRDCSTGTPSTV